MFSRIYSAIKIDGTNLQKNDKKILGAVNHSVINYIAIKSILATV